MKRLLTALAALLLLSGCATYGDGYYQGREVYRDGGYYYPAYEGEGDYYYGEDYDDYRYDYGYGVGYGYGYAPFHGLDRYRCRSYYGCTPVWGGYYPYSYSPGWSFGFGNYWSWNNWGWYGGYRSRDYYRDYYRDHDRGYNLDRQRDHDYERERIRHRYPGGDGKPNPGPNYRPGYSRPPSGGPRPSVGGEPVRPQVRRAPEATVRPMPSSGGEAVRPSYPGLRTKPAPRAMPRPMPAPKPAPEPRVRTTSQNETSGDER